MRVAVLSDIHANRPALDAILAQLPSFDTVWQLGDVVGYGPHPVPVIDRLVEIGATGVRGNHDAAAIGLITTDWFNADARTAVEWSARQLTPAASSWLRALPERREEEAFTLVHGSPRDPVWEYVYSAPVARRCFERFSSAYCLVGHTHVPLVFRETDGAIETIVPGDGAVLKLDGRRAIINPGSVGQPRDGDPRAAAMLLDTDAGTVTWLRVPYPIATTQKAMRAARLPVRLVQRLDYGL